MKKWRLFPSIRYVNFRAKYPQAAEDCWKQWFSVERRWGGRIVHLFVLHHAIVLDFRRNWISDLVEGC